ncbi:hypothetical protein KJS94_03050 [Flavihumibacter rivuli]|uniref:hypothetical protein n=1 Tax=Flavihumibacter rivuli TaxID=2838156 RepID=UPI001BDED7A2|nr:hypothetical protein [Flavihumibacter rivuli]ULQ57175.1 hypothetical protein KJS94_03050 [Flavihumibacter rivuli]
MKRQWLFSALLLLTVSAQAQRVDLDKFSFTVAYRNLPRVPIDTSYHTFNFQLETGPLMKLGVNNERPEESMEIDGWKRVQVKGHITVDLKMEDIMIVGANVEERVEEIKDKTGKVTGKRTWFRPVFTYTYAGRVLITDYKGNQLQQYQLATRNQQQQHRGTEYSSKLEAIGLTLNMITIGTQLSKDLLYRTINNLSNNLSNMYGYSEMRVNDFVWILDSRKHAEYDKFRRNFAMVKDAFFRITPHEPVTAIREELKPAIDYFTKLPKYYSGSGKSDRKIRYAAHFLLAKLYYYLDDPDNAAREATNLVLNDYDARDGRYLESVAIGLKEQFTLTKRTTRHFPWDVNSFEPPNLAKSTAQTNSTSKQGKE